MNVFAGVISYRFHREDHAFDEGESTSYDNVWYSGITDFMTKFDFEYSYNPQHYIRFGVEGIMHRFNPSKTSIKLESPDMAPVEVQQNPEGVLDSQEWTLYAEDDIQLYRDISVTAGLRLSIYHSAGTIYHSVEPRTSISMLFTENTAVKLSVTRMRQYIHLLSGVGYALPAELWVLSMDGIPPQKGYQVAAGVSRNIRDNYELSVEGYFKHMNGRLAFKDDAEALPSYSRYWPSLTETGTSTSRGMEVFAQKKTGRLTGWAAYTWARSTVQFTELNNGIAFPDNYDRRHDISVALQYARSERRKLAAAWIYGSGYPVWLPTRYYIGSNFNSGWQAGLFSFGPRNNTRGPASH